MSVAADVLTRLAAAGIRLSADAGRIFATPKAALADEHRALILEHKPALVEALAPRRLYRVTDPDGHVSDVSYCPPQTLAQVMDWHPGFQVEPIAEPAMDAPIPAGVAALVDAYLDRIGEFCPGTRREALALAASRPDIAQGYRDRAAQEGRQEPAASPPPEDLEESVAEAVDERIAVLIHLGGMPEPQAREVARRAEGYYRHHWSCPACRAGTQVGAKLHRPCADGKILWDRYADAAAQGDRS